MLQLYIGNKNYSSWSMRAWLILKAFDVPFTEHLLPFDDFAADGQFKQDALQLSMAGKVPVLIDGNVRVWDSLAIAEYLAETHPHLPLWPSNQQQRAHARVICAEMHSGFPVLRSLCPMNIEAQLSEVGKTLWQEHEALRQEVAYLHQMWGSLLADGRGFLFGEFGIADAFYAPVVSRLHTYGLPLKQPVKDYCERVQAHPAVAQWIQDALNEHWFVPVDEPYRSAAS